MTFDEILNQARKNAADIDKIGKRLGFDLASYFPTQLKQLNDCLDTYSAAKVMIATTIADASGELSLENVAKLAANFDKNWDKFAQEYNAIFSHLPEASKTNVLETFAKAHFGTKVFEAGSVIKNETPSILSGIVSFRAGINSFKGSFRNPQEAANKINNGVNLIVNSTAQIAGSLNNIVKFLQGGKSASAPGNVVLTKLSQLPQMKAVAAVTSVLGISASGIAAVNTGSGAISALRKGDYATALSQGKATYENAKKVFDEVKKLKTGTMGAKPTPQIDGNKAPTPSAANGQQQSASDNKQPASNNKKDSSKSSDSYVCSTAKIKCSYGDRISTLTVYPDRTIWLTGQPQANISDHISMRNIAPFGRCHTIAFPPTGSATAANHGSLTPMPCMPNTPFPWMGGKNDVLLKGQPALLKSSKCKCLWGGTITITFDGQTQGDTTLVQTVSKFKTENELSRIRLGANALPDNIGIDDRLKLAEHTIHLAKSLNMGIDPPMSIEQADKQSANPNYKAGNDYSINCATVVQAYALRLQGLNVTANPNNKEHKLNDWIASGHVFDVWKNIDGSNARPSTYVEWMERKGVKNMNPELYKEFIEENTKEEGVYIINVGWKGGGGHATIIQKWKDNNGELHLSYIEPQVYNAQVGAKQSIDNLVANMDSSPSDGRGIMRVDNKMFDPEYLSLFEKPNGNTLNNNKTSA